MRPASLSPAVRPGDWRPRQQIGRPVTQGSGLSPFTALSKFLPSKITRTVVGMMEGPKMETMQVDSTGTAREERGEHNNGVTALVQTT